MKSFNRKQFVSPHRAAAAVLLAAGLVPAIAGANLASNTTIRNTVYVDYADAGAVVQPQISDEVDVVVQLVAATPSLSNPTDTATTPDDQTIAPSSTATYNYAVWANANGPDTYNLSTTIGTITNLSGAGATTSLTTASVSLGATTVAVAPGAIAANTPTAITVPSDAASNATVNGIAALDKVVIGGVICDVTAVSDSGTAGTGAISNSTVTVDCDAAVNPTVGTVIGELATFSVTVDPTSLNAGFTTGSVVVNTLARDAANAQPAASDPTTTFVEQLLSVTKYVRNVDTGAAGSAPSVTVAGATYYASGVVATPGQVLEYLIAVTNTSTTNAATDVVISDAIPEFTTFSSTGFAVIDNTGLVGGVTAANSTPNDGDAGEVVSNVVYLYPGSSTPGDDTASPPGNVNGDGGTVAAGESAYGRFRVTVN